VVCWRERFDDRGGFDGGEGALEGFHVG
jgi:hypothetical protein